MLVEVRFLGPSDHLDKNPMHHALTEDGVKNLHYTHIRTETSVYRVTSLSFFHPDPGMNMNTRNARVTQRLTFPENIKYTNLLMSLDNNRNMAKDLLMT